MQVPEWIQRVGRTKTTGDWKNWFTATDVETLRPRFAPYLEFFGYPDDWQLPQQRRVKPEHASAYVTWILDLRSPYGLTEFALVDRPRYRYPRSRA